MWTWRQSLRYWILTPTVTSDSDLWDKAQSHWDLQRGVEIVRPGSVCVESGVCEIRGHGRFSHTEGGASLEGFLSSRSLLGRLGQVEPIIFCHGTMYFTGGCSVLSGAS